MSSGLNLHGRCAWQLLNLSVFEDVPTGMIVARRHTVAPAPALVSHVVARRALLVTTAAVALPAAMRGMPLPFAPVLLPDVTFPLKGTEADLRRVPGQGLAVAVAEEEAAAAAAAEVEAAQTGPTLFTSAPGNATAVHRMGPARAVPGGRRVSRETAT